MSRLEPTRAIPRDADNDELSPADSASRRAGAAHWARLLAFVALAFVILIAPGRAALLKRRDHRWLPQWTMFSLQALDLFEVEFMQGHPDGSRTPVDQYTMLGYVSRFDAPTRIRRITSELDAYDLARMVCARAGRDVKLFMRLRDATRAGWRMVEPGREEICPRITALRQAARERHRRAGR